MNPKPRGSCLLDAQKRLSVRRKAVTVAIGMYGVGGVFVCADSHVISGDGTVTWGTKVKGRGSSNGSFVIANAADDGNAADMLAEEILDALTNTRGELGASVKKTMKTWHAGYVHSKPPSIQFVLGVVVGKSRGLYFCEPPNTVLLKNLDEHVAIGVGAEIIDPLAPEVIRGPLVLREALIRAAYLMYRAKKQHAFLKGSDTHALVVSTETGEIRSVDVEETRAAEAIGPDVDFMLRYCYLGLLGTPRNIDQTDFLKSFSHSYLEKRSKIDAVQFPSIPFAMT